MAAPAIGCEPGDISPYGQDISPYIAPRTIDNLADAPTGEPIVACEFVPGGCGGHNRRTAYTDSCCGKNTMSAGVVRAFILGF